MGVALGIDLGTTNSCVAIVQGDQAKVVESVYGDRIHPSIVSFHPNGETLAGGRAKERLAIDPLNTVYSFKRLLGQDLESPDIKKLISGLPYNVVQKNGIPVLQTRNREATLPEIGAIMLRYLKDMVSETFGQEITDAIITVPANFTDIQRASTKIAGKIAGFNVLRILNEPTAAALAYGFGGDKEERIAVFDFGGGTFDITIIELLDDIFEVLSTAGDNFLGGDDLDAKLVFEMLEQFKKQNGFSILEDPVALQRIRSVAERVKCQLSTIDEVSATLRELAKDRRGRSVDFTFKITRHRFNQLIQPLLERALATCEEALALAKLSAEELDNVVLVGGTTRVPLVREQVETFFQKTPRTEVNPDEVVAIGAAINAYSLTGEALDAGIKPKRKRYSADNPFLTAPDNATEKQSSRNVSNQIDDPFASAPPGLATDDPFSDRKLDNDKSALGQINLTSKRTILGMNVPASGQDLDLPVPVASPEGIADLPAPVSPKSEDSWEDISRDESNRLAPSPGAAFSSDDPLADLPGLVEEKPLADLPGLVDEEPDADLPGLVDEEPDADLPGLVDEEPDADLPGLVDEEPDADLPGLPDVDADLPQVVERSSNPSSDVPELSLDDVEEIDESLDAKDSTEEIDDLSSVELVDDDAPSSEETASEAFGFVPVDVSPDDEVDVFSTPTDDFDVAPQIHHPLDEVEGTGDTPHVPTHSPEFVVPVKNTTPAVLLDVTPRALGVATAGGYCDIIIERNAAIPLEQSRQFSTSHDNQTQVVIDVYQGESRRTAENTQLGRIELLDIRPAPRGAICVTVTFEIDTDGILNVRAVNDETGEAHSTAIKLTGGLEEEHVNALMEKYSGNAN